MKKEIMMIGIVALGAFWLINRQAATKTPKVAATNTPLYSNAQPGTTAWGDWLKASGYVP